MPPSETLGLVATNERSRLHLQHTLDNAECGLTVCLCPDIATLRAVQAEDTLRFVAVWEEETGVSGDVLGKELRQWSNPPVLLLATESIQPHHYRQASRMGARGVIDLTEPAVTAFVIQREREHRDVAQRLTQALNELSRNRIVDESIFMPLSPPDTVSPIADEIDHALQTDAVELLFQPIVGLREDAREIYEVFARIRGTERYLEPAEFLPVARRYGLMPALDRCVVRNAAQCYQNERAARSAADTSNLALFLNISAQTLVEAPSINKILRMLVATQPQDGAFVLELDKSTIVSRLQLAKSLNQFIKRRKLAFAIDEFEPADERLNYARHVTVDFVKLTRSAIADIDRDRRKRAALEQLIKSTQARGLRVIATQIEKTAELVPLYQAGVDYVQGYLIAAPSRQLAQSATMREILG